MSDTIIHKKHEENEDKEDTEGRRNEVESENKRRQVSETNTLYSHSSNHK